MIPDDQPTDQPPNSFEASTMRLKKKISPKSRPPPLKLKETNIDLVTLKT